jgi:hypothetical protein
MENSIMKRYPRPDKNQLEFDWVFPSDLAPCDHSRCFVTNAHVPAGVYCDKCHRLISQFIPQSPEQLGYVSADWAYVQEHGPTPFDEK